MKNSIIYLLIIFCFGSLSAQEVGDSNVTLVDTTSDKIKLTKEERHAFRKEKVAQYIAWERKYFNSPGKWYIGLEAGYGFPFLTTEPEAVPPVTFLGSSNFFQGENGVTYDKLLLSGKGGGFRTSFVVGKMFNHFVGLEMKFGYFKGTTDNLSTINTPGFKATLDNDLYELSANPHLVLRSPNLRNVYIFGKIGPYLPLFGRPRATVNMDDRDGSIIIGLLEGDIVDILTPIVELDLTKELLQLLDYRATLHAETAISLQQYTEENSIKEIIRGIGISAGAGFRYQFSPIASLYGEIAVRGYNISLSRVLIDDLDVNITLLGGNVSLLTLTENGGTAFGMELDVRELKSLIETSFVNELTQESNNPNYNPDGLNPFNPREELAPRLSVVSVGFNVGLQINFPGKDVYYRENSKKAQKVEF
jgi:hypothetical protein